MVFKRPRRAILLGLVLLLSVLVLSPNVKNVYGPTNITFVQTTAINDACSPTTCSTASFIDVTGDTIIVFIAGVGVFNGFVYSDSQSNTYAQKVASITANGAGSSSYIAAATVATGGVNTVTVTTGGASRIYAIWAEEYRNVLSYGVTATSQNDAITQAATSYVSTLTFTSTAGSGSAIVETDTVRGTGSTVSITYNNGQTQRQFSNNGPNVCFTGSDCQSDDYAVAATSFSISNSMSWSAGCGAPPACFDSHSGLELVGQAPASITTVTQCYGNCGTPAVTLANTNSTHAINWNQSITIFYEFQPTVTGFLKNITTNLPKTYSSSVFSPGLGFYQSNCPLGQTPFTAQCPGQLQLGGGGSSGPFAKGKISFGGGPQYVVQSASNIWYGVALSFQISPADVNDTNTQVQIFQTTGNIPPVIGQSSVFNGASKIGIWAWVVGNIVSTTPPPAPTTNCAGIIDCVIPNIVNGSCNIVTSTCQTGGAIFWIIILTIITIGVLIFFFGQVMPSVNIGRVGLGEIAVLAFFGWMVAFNAAGVLASWVMIFMFFIVAWLFMGRLKGSGPI